MFHLFCFWKWLCFFFNTPALIILLDKFISPALPKEGPAPAPLPFLGRQPYHILVYGDKGKCEKGGDMEGVNVLRLAGEG